MRRTDIKLIDNKELIVKLDNALKNCHLPTRLEVKSVICDLVDEAINKARKEELYFLTHLFQNKESPDGDVVAMSLIISSVSPFAKLVNSRIEILKDALEDLGVKK